MKTDRLKLFNKISRSRRNAFVKKICGRCENLVWNEEYQRWRCSNYLVFFFLWCDDQECPEIKVSEQLLIEECWKEETSKKLLKPGGGEKSDRTHKMFGKERMKDNRVRFRWDEL